MSPRCCALLVTLGMVPASLLHGQELPPRAVARLGDYRFHHGSSIELVALSPDGSRVASLARKARTFRDVPDQERDPLERTIVLWDASSGQRLRELQAPGRSVSSLAFSPDSKRLLVICDNLYSGEQFPRQQIQLFEIDSGKIVDQFGPFESAVHFQRFSVDGKRLLLGEGDDTVISFDIASRKTIAKWRAPLPKSDRRRAVAGRQVSGLARLSTAGKPRSSPSRLEELRPAANRRRRD
jgi:WD40 repeat protein